MNIFVTDIDPIIAATHLDDLRLNKMIVETTQMLVTNLLLIETPEVFIPKTKQGTLYRITHPSHPVTRWIGQSQQNYLWAVKYALSLLHERELRFPGTRHGCTDAIEKVSHQDYRFADVGLTSFINSSMFPKCSDICKAYQATLLVKWSQDLASPKWTVRGAPPWGFLKDK